MLLPHPLLIWTLLGSSAASPSTSLHSFHQQLAVSKIVHGFVEALQEPAAPVSVWQSFLNVTRDLGDNNPSIQFDGVNFHYHFKRGDAGWISAFEVANANHIHRIVFPRGVYWFKGNGTKVDVALYQNLWSGTALKITGDGDYLTSFTTYAPIVDGPMLQLATSRTIVTMSWHISGMHFDGCSTDFALSVNRDGHAQPRVEFNNLHLADVSFHNHLEHNTCHGRRFPWRVGQVSDAAKGALFLGHIWSSNIDVGLATVATSAAPQLFNVTGGVVLNEVQYSTMSLRGAGTHSDASFGTPAPWNASAYNGWGIILQAHVYANTVAQTHCEGSGGCVLISGPGSFENQWTSAVMSMMQHALIIDSGSSSYNVFNSIVVNRYPVRNVATGRLERFSKRVVGPADRLLVKHMTVIGDGDGDEGDQLVII